MKILFFLFLVFLKINLYCAQTSTLKFLKVFSNSVYSAQGRALTPFNQTTKFFYNPAYNTDDKLITISYNNYTQDLKASFIGYSFNNNSNINYGVGILNFDYGDIRQTFIDITERPYYGDKLSGNSLLFLFNINLIGKKKYNIGFNCKYVQDKLFVKTAKAFLIDAGANIKFSENYGLGIKIANAGSKIKYYLKEEAAPISYSADFYWRNSKLLLNIGVEKEPSISEIEKKFSIEYELLKEIKLRTGYNSNADSINDKLSYGFSFSFKNLIIDFSYSDFKALGNENILSINYNF